ncbi:hypothetical protein HGM15179_013734 [Zosterops borbonicus]|uniref:Uncharacterized protein n=1 Tax=Zosterops borbonicus TaxID=364589 RepID=A0A8K1G885_9PASS|nr:hypothetical protein HGM15179_013734 [Zosterops borbonicus]
MIPPDVQFEPSLMELEAISSYPVTGCLREEANHYLATASFQGVFCDGCNDSCNKMRTGLVMRLKREAKMKNICLSAAKHTLQQTQKHRLKAVGRIVVYFRDVLENNVRNPLR